MTNIFVYGTLMWEEIARSVISGSYRKARATLTGYARKRIRGEWYPGIRPEAHTSVDGWVWFDVSEEDIHRLDRFEGDEYVRMQETVKGRNGETIPVEVYKIREDRQDILESAEWSEKQFEEEGLAEFVKTPTP